MTMRNSKIFPIGCALLFLAAILFMVCSGCMPSAEVDVPEVDIAQTGLQMPGNALANQLGNVTVQNSYVFDVGSQHFGQHGLGLSVTVESITIKANGLPNLDFIQAAQFTLSNPQSTTKTIKLIDYPQSPGLSKDGTITLMEPKSIDIMDLWTGNSITATFSVTGTVPATAWAVDVKLVLSGKATYAVGKQ
jgi:hypothetical protein